MANFVPVICNLCFVSDPKIRSYTVTCHTEVKVNKLSVSLCKTAHWVELPFACKMRVFNPLVHYVPSSFLRCELRVNQNINFSLCIIVSNYNLLVQMRMGHTLKRKWDASHKWCRLDFQFSMSTVGGCGLIGLSQKWYCLQIWQSNCLISTWK